MSDQAMRVQRLFDSKAAGWPDKYASGGRLTGRLAQFAAAVAELEVPGGELLDLGCGSGELARQMAVAGYRVTGCDIAPQMLRQAVAADRGHSVRWLRLQPGWRVLPVETGSLDVVLASSVLEYLPMPGHVLVECARVLRPGGVLLCTVPNPAHPLRWLEWLLRLAARTPLAVAARRAGPRFAQYTSYLLATPQPRSDRWWQAAARQSGLESATALRPARAPLRLLAFTPTPAAYARGRSACD
jgi:2-polyprenyl-3-methyl-5-hydroxy-6-metoxy-1,4-benzoquinol methylase